ncbi:MAG: tyrosine-type recombinase/integrase [Muribaculaceae bacterium]|nr:tyrosine-type recombinase/integrase [Muribaculaceae bacterium]
MFAVQLRTKNAEGVAPLYTRLRVGGKSIWVNLLLTVDIKKWNEVSSTSKKKINFLDRLGFTKKLSEMEFGIKELREHNRLNKESLDNVIKSVALSEVREDFLKDEEIKKEFEEKKRKEVKTFVKNYIDSVANGSILNMKGKPYSKNSINCWKQFKRIFIQCYKNYSFSWEELSQVHIHTFLKYLDRHGYMGETKNRFVGIYRTLITISEKQRLHNNGIVKKWLSAPKVNDNEKRTLIYLTKEELTALYNMPLNGLKEQVRDLFLIGCFTAMRYDEFSKIEKGCIGYTQKGTHVIRIRQGKVNENVVIPILNEELEVLLKKYDYTVPFICDQILNRYIKEICEELSQTVPSLQKKTRTLLTKTEREGVAEGRLKFEYDDSNHVIKPKWELITCHTARRTAVTNMYLSKKFTLRQIMSVSGHKKEETFNKYIRLSLDEKADDVASVAADGLF